VLHPVAPKAIILSLHLLSLLHFNKSV
jgi:hypothetical protein